MTGRRRRRRRRPAEDVLLLGRFRRRLARRRRFPQSRLDHRAEISRWSRPVRAALARVVVVFVVLVVVLILRVVGDLGGGVAAHVRTLRVGDVAVVVRAVGVRLPSVIEPVPGKFRARDGGGGGGVGGDGARGIDAEGVVLVKLLRADDVRERAPETTPHESGGGRGRGRGRGGRARVLAGLPRGDDARAGEHPSSARRGGGGGERLAVPLRDARLGIVRGPAVGRRRALRAVRPVARGRRLLRHALLEELRVGQQAEPVEGVVHARLAPLAVNHQRVHRALRLVRAHQKTPGELLELGEQKPIGRQRPAARGVEPKLLHRFRGERQSDRACRGGAARVRVTRELPGSRGVE